MGALSVESANAAQDPAPNPDTIYQVPDNVFEVNDNVPEVPPDDVINTVDRNVNAFRSDARPLSSVPRLLQNMRRNLGFSVGIFGTYAPGSLVSSGEQKDVMARSLDPHLFINMRKGRSRFFFDYGVLYSEYWREHRSSVSHTVMLDFDRIVSRRTTFRLTDLFDSSFNDHGASNALPPDVNMVQAVQTLDVPYQRVSQNSVVASLEYQLSRKSTINVFGNHVYWRYTSAELGNVNSVSVGIRASYHVKKWLYIDNSYSHSLNATADALNPNIHSLRVGNFRFRSRSGWEFFVGAGVDATRFSGHYEGTAATEAGISKSSTSTRISLIYHRGFFTTVGGAGVLQGDSLTASLGRSFGWRINFDATAQYVGGSTAGAGDLRYATGNARIGFAVQRHVQISANYWTVSQQIPLNLSPGIAAVSRNTITAGVHYYLPSLSER
jgi:hypothetical protein